MTASNVRPPLRDRIKGGLAYIVEQRGAGLAADQIIAGLRTDHGVDLKWPEDMSDDLRIDGWICRATRHLSLFEKGLA